MLKICSRVCVRGAPVDSSRSLGVEWTVVWL